MIKAENLSLSELEALAARLGSLLRAGDMVTLRGEVGAGKTTFARALIHSIAKEKPEVTSPTFTLMQSYDVTLAGGQKETLWHLDLYRLEEPEEAEALGLRELEAHVVLIEWPEIIEHMLPALRLDITLAFGSAPDTRNLALAGNDAWRGRLASLNMSP